MLLHGEIDETLASCLILAHSLRCVMSKRGLIHKTVSKCIALPSEEDQAMATGIMYRQLGEI